MKGVTICFRTNEELRDALELAARGDRRSLLSAVELILTDYMEKNHEFLHRGSGGASCAKRCPYPPM